ncbi:threonine synthase [Roseibium porphyridii]|uniref:Threonine synthase n=1 Tax=Roseibium porphyridii TaxID=2866279 RepID=A0ABY8F0G4_9HYPH|nr:threonine synthase [Roseibium sp. KMA01]WFE88946.1 threonine synthase [Roseibium sp. KMA01]
MKYTSTRGEAPVLEFSDVLLQGLARDGGLYLPETWPQFDAETIASFAGKPYEDVAFQAMQPFVGGDIPDDDLKSMISEAYQSFRHPAVTPLVQTDANTFVLELFHGPTLAFKDVAMQLLGRMMDYVLAKRGLRATIVGATSGDTGGAAIDAFRGRDRTDIFILFPDGRVSNVQRRQMTTPEDANVHALALTGNFDDCQAIVKGMFNHFSFRDRVALSGVNSINWARILAQIVYYFVAGAALGSPHRKVSFTVPTGNFGDIFAGYAAMKMGLPVEKLIVATNVNDILARTLETGRYEKRGVTPTISPSMDIQVSSNFERLLSEVCGKDGAVVQRMMNQLAQSGSFTIDDGPLADMRRSFGAGRCDEAQTSSTIARVWEDAGYLLDPHTAIGVHVAKEQNDGSVPMVVLGTAHPAKFPDAVEKAAGIHPELPENLKDMMSAEERQQILAADQDVVERYIEDHARAVTAGV